jgi:hypothetical protein
MKPNTLQATLTSFLVLALGPFLQGCGGGSDGGSTPVGIHINEVMPANAATCADQAGQYDDWIEIFNSSDSQASLGGLSITDDPDVPLKRVLPASLVVPARGFLILWADDDTSQGETHLPFKLSASGEQVLLYGKDGTLIDQVSWANAVADVSYARVPDGTGAFVSCRPATCGMSNGTGCAAVGP